MPQMSPMMWLYLFMYFLFSYMLIIIMINNLIKFLNNNKNINKIINYKKILLFKFKW